MKCGADKAYAFITDFRNFDKFAKNAKVTDWQADEKSCSFNVAMLGVINVNLAEKEETSKAVFQGVAAGNIDFTVTVQLNGNNPESSKIHINLSAYFNPIMKMMADKYVRMFLDMLITEIEKLEI